MLFFRKVYQSPKIKKPRSIGALLLLGAGKEVRTPDPQLGKLMLYQLSYSRLKNEHSPEQRSILKKYWHITPCPPWAEAIPA